VAGRIFDVVVDMRKGSPGYGKWFGVELSSENRKMIYVPVGFAHGFAALSERVEILYKVSAEYDKASEAGVIWNDPALGVKWPLENPILSEKDALLPPFEKADSDFIYKPTP
jgi:dTDP-4-dehydrorhamnose 3,5-epimerase